MMAFKSVDVGSMFLMDLSVGEPDQHQKQQPLVGVENGHEGLSLNRSPPSTSSGSQRKPSKPQVVCDDSYRLTCNPPQINRGSARRRSRPYDNTIDDSLKRIANALEDDEDQYDEKCVDQSLETAVEPSPDCIEDQLALSLSDVSFVTSSDDSISVSYTACSETDEEERISTTTREDSGVIDVKDLEYQLNNTSDPEQEDMSKDSRPLRNKQENSISNITDIDATNLINELVDDSEGVIYSKRATNQLARKPTNSMMNKNSDHGNRHPKYHHHSSKRSMSASLPIQVPARQMKSDLNKLKLGLINEDRESAWIKSDTRRYSAFKKLDDIENSATGDVENFLDQEFNENHHNHYPSDEFDEMPPRAEDDPMRLFESMQALSRSLNKDTELFGSLPPKRLLASPLRSLALAQ